MARIVVAIQAEEFDSAAVAGQLAQGRSDIGALVTFTGLCRDEDGRLAALELEHYPGMAEGELARIAEAATQRWALHGVAIVHRYGRIVPGEAIMMVAAASSHRADAFAAADFLMDYLKTRAPFWKKEHHRDGTAGEWVAATAQDDAAAERWR